MLLGQVKLEDVFQSTRSNMEGGTSGIRFLALLLSAIALIVLLVLVQQRRKKEGSAAALNHQGKLLREVSKSLPIKGVEMKQLKQLADEQSCSSPLTLLLCPSLLAKSVQNRAPQDRKVAAGVAKKLVQ